MLVPATCAQVAPPSVLLKTPAPRTASPLGLVKPSPVPARMVVGSPGFRASAVTARLVSVLSPTGAQLAPLFVVLKTPPATPPAYQVAPGPVGSITIARVRPPMLPGPTLVQVPRFGLAAPTSPPRGLSVARSGRVDVHLQGPLPRGLVAVGGHGRFAHGRALQGEEFLCGGSRSLWEGSRKLVFGAGQDGGEMLTGGKREGEENQDRGAAGVGHAILPVARPAPGADSGNACEPAHDNGLETLREP